MVTMVGPSHHRSSRFENISDLRDLSPIAEDTVLACLRERYLASSPYTSISASALVSVNPHAYLPTNGDASLQDYVAEYHTSAVDDVSRRQRDSGGSGSHSASSLSSGGRRKLNPHVYRLGLDALYNMRRTGQDQIILLNGAVGSGKTELRRMIVKAISEVSVASPGKKGGKIGAQIANAQFILESFGNAQTLTNDNASRFGNYTELQFNDRGRLEGSKSIEYYFERSRVSQPPATGERNFHVFYYLIAGVQGEERAHLKLGTVNDYRYLQCRIRRQGPDDKNRFEQLKQAFKVLSMSGRLVAQVCQLLATILHIGNLQFQSGGSDHEGATVTNFDGLSTVAEFLGVSTEALSELFAFKTILVRKEVCTTFLEPEGAEAVRDELARTLYSLLFSWLNEHVNQKLCKDAFSSFIALLDLPGSQNNAGLGGGVNSVDQFCFNFANEKVYNWVLHRIHEAPLSEASKEKLSMTRMPYFDNAECLRLLQDPKGGLIRIVDNEAMKKRSEESMLEAMGKRFQGHTSFSLGNTAGQSSFTINHYNGPVTYSAENFLERNANETSADILRLLRGSDFGQHANGEVQGSNNPFIKSLFSNKSIATQTHPRNDDTIVAVQQPVKPMRAPSTRRKKGRRPLAAVAEADEGDAGVDDYAVGGGNQEVAAGKELHCMAGQHLSALNTLLSTFTDAQPWFVFCLRPNESQLPNQVETRCLKAQIRSFGLPEMAARMATWYEVKMTHEEAIDRYSDELDARGVMEGPSWKDRLVELKRILGATDAQMAIGQDRVFLSHELFRQFEDRLRGDSAPEPRTPNVDMLDAPRQMLDPFSPYHRTPSPLPSPSSPIEDPYERNHSSAALPLVSNAAAFREESFDEAEYKRPFAPSEATGSRFGDTASVAGTDTYAPSRNMFRDSVWFKEKDVLDEQPEDAEVQEEFKESLARRRWVWLCWALTWWIPSFLLSSIGKMKRQDVRQAWREKLTINLIIWFICGCTVFVIAILGPLICPTQHVYSSAELASHNYKDNPNNAFVAIRGEVFDLSQFAPTHLTSVSVVPTKSIMQYGGLDATNLFPVQVSALCSGTTGQLSSYVTLDTTNTTDVNMQYHDFRAYTNDSRPDWYEEMMIMMRYKYRTGFMGYTKKTVRSMASAGRAVAIYDGLVYDLTTYKQQNGGGLKTPNGYQVTAQDTADRQFMAGQVVDLFTYNAGKDISQLLDNLDGTIGKAVVDAQKVCLRNLFLLGKVDTRDSAQCQFSTYILLALSCVMVAIIGFKFLSALYFGSSRRPENLDKFVICQVPCYTEGEESVRRTIDSLARLKYDDKRKLLFIICDGNIRGHGNDKPTPAIVLDLLGVDPYADPDPLSFQSLGEGAKQHNMGKVYSGLYESGGHVVPYVVVVKVGKPTERPKPGNRGKRDSQMMLMHFLNKVHFNAPMNPLELEIYHRIKNVVGVSPTFYEYIFMVDADTTVEEGSLSQLVSSMVHDRKIIGACGETSIANSKQSIVTMAQVYEYFISHHLTKAFESLFGSITCLPGCFSIYRLRTPDTHKPLFISNQIIHDYSENRVDTLHLKNLLHLGEDRYLTTLVLKHFPTYKTKFVRGAHAQTIAPDSVRVLLSQRRRWINSTVHNLAELVFLEQLCGFCCFSMRFIVFIDLLSTIIAPVTVAYIGYLIYLVVHDGTTVPILSIIMLAAIYGLQALIFVFRMRWDMIAWMIFYILAIPVFSFFLPLYSFWKMDDFSWGSTRLVVGDKGKKIVIHDEGKFDPRSIPLKTWQDHENELWDQQSADGGDEKFEAPGLGMKDEYGYGTPPGSHYGGFVPSQHGSYVDLHAAQNQRALSTHESMPRLPYTGEQLVGGSPSTYGQHLPPNTETGPVFGGDVNRHRTTSFYSQAAVPAMQSRASTYSMNTPLEPSPTGAGVHPYHRAASSYSLLPDLNGSGELPAGGQPTEDMLENGIRRIFAGTASFDDLSKKKVRTMLEQEFGVDLAARRTEVNALVDKVLGM